MPSAGQLLNLEVKGRHIAENTVERSKNKLDSRDKVLPFESWRIFDAYQTNLPTTAASDDLGLIIGTLGTDAVRVRTSDAKNTTVTQKARLRFSMPDDYVAGESVKLVPLVGMETTVANGTATIDLSAYPSDFADGTVDADVVTTGATTINSLTPGEKEFELTATDLEPGSEIDVLVTIAITDSATATAVLGRILKLTLRYDGRG